MFASLKKVLIPTGWLQARTAPLAQWAQEHALSFNPTVGGAFSMAGRWQDRPVRIQCVEASRPFMQGMELMARADLGARHEGNVVVMNRHLKDVLETQSRALYSKYTDDLQTMAGVVPEEVRWLAMYRDAGWAGPDRRFWRRYAVLTDAPDTARRWIDSEVEQRLMNWPEPVSAETPVMLMLQRGKTYMRMQVDRGGDTAAAVHAFGLFDCACRSALDMQAR